jgi:hypothetical protein
MTTTWTNIKTETDEVLKTVAHLSCEDVSSLLWNVAKARGIVIVQSFVPDDFLRTRWDADAIMNYLCSKSNIMERIRDAMTEILEEEEVEAD